MEVKSQMMRSWWAALPFTTSVFFALCVGLFVLSGILRVPHSSCCLSTHTFNFVALLTSSFHHHDLWHLIFNMMASLSVSPSVERQLGTGPLFALVMLIVAVTESVHLFIGMVLPQWDTCVLGYSAVLFGLFAADSWMLPQGTNVSVCGFVTMDAKYMPWALLVFASILFPGASFLGHLTGLLTGYFLIAVVPQRIWASAAGWAIRQGWLTSRDGFCSGQHAALPLGGVVCVATGSGFAPVSGSPSCCSVSGAMATSSGATGSHVSGFPSLPEVPPPDAREFAPFAGQGRKLGGGQQSVATVTGAMPPMGNATGSSNSVTGADAGGQSTTSKGVSSRSASANSSSTHHN